MHLQSTDQSVKVGVLEGMVKILNYLFYTSFAIPRAPEWSPQLLKYAVIILPRCSFAILLCCSVICSHKFLQHWQRQGRVERLEVVGVCAVPGLPVRRLGWSQEFKKIVGKAWDSN